MWLHNRVRFMVREGDGDMAGKAERKNDLSCCWRFVMNGFIECCSRDAGKVSHCIEQESFVSMV